jgi:hypothetical protein
MRLPPTSRLSPSNKTRLRLLARSLIGPAAVATFAGIELRGYGALGAAAGAYVVFVLAQLAVGLWARRQLELARRRLALARQRSKRTTGLRR